MKLKWYVKEQIRDRQIARNAYTLLAGESQYCNPDFLITNTGTASLTIRYQGKLVFDLRSGIAIRWHCGDWTRELAILAQEKRHQGYVDTEQKRTQQVIATRQRANFVLC